MKILITGATGKVGQTLIRHLLADETYANATFRALCHNRSVDPDPRIDVVRGSISDSAVIKAAMDGITHVVHLATCKETPEDIVAVSFGGLFGLLEVARQSDTFERFMLISGDASVGHFFYPYERPITEDMPVKAYPGCYAFSKAIEETMLEQYYHQYDLDGCCLRAPWIMEKDDFKYSLSFGDDIFGGPRWCDLVSPEQAARYVEKSTVPVMCDAEGQPIKRNFVHVDDLVSAIALALLHPAARQHLFNIAMERPVDYREVADYLKATRDYDSVDIKTEFHSTWLDINKARHRLGWQPHYDLPKLIDASWSYQRAEDDPRKIWYPG